MKLDLPKTREIQERIKEAEDFVKNFSESRQLKQEIELTKGQLSKAESMDEYSLISEKIQMLQEQLTEVDIKIRMQPKIRENVLKSETPKIKDTYNQEFKPYHDKYLKLDKELKKQLKKFAEATEPIVHEMTEIERLEQSFHHLKTRATDNFKEIIRLPIDKRKVEPDMYWNTPITYGAAQSTNLIINKIKKHWGDKK